MLYNDSYIIIIYKTIYIESKVFKLKFYFKNLQFFHKIINLFISENRFILIYHIFIQTMFYN